MIVLVRKIALHRCQEKRPESATLPVRHFQKVLLNQQGEETLGEVLGLIAVMAAPANERIDRIPVGFAQLFQRRSGIHRRVVARRQDETP